MLVVVVVIFVAFAFHFYFVGFVLHCALFAARLMCNRVRKRERERERQIFFFWFYFWLLWDKGGVQRVDPICGTSYVPSLSYTSFLRCFLTFLCVSVVTLIFTLNRFPGSAFGFSEFWIF